MNGERSRVRPEDRRRFALAGAVAAFVLLAAGCGAGSKAPSVASIVSPTTTGARAARTPTGPKPSRAAFAACLTAHGFAAAVGSAADAGANEISILGVQVSGNVDPNSRPFQQALASCRALLPGGGPPGMTSAQRAQAAKAMLRFAACMRTHGVPGFPDPSGQGAFPPGGLQAIDPNSPQVETAFKSCESLEPKVGPWLQL
jgi:hypothetical protein